MKIELDKIDKIPVENYSAPIIESVANGYSDPIEAYVLGKYLEAIGKQIQEGVKDEAISYVDELHKDERKCLGRVLELRSIADTYDFKQDSEYLRLDTELKERKKLLTKACKLRGTKERVIMDDEIIEPVPVSKAGGYSLTVKL